MPDAPLALVRCLMDMAADHGLHVAVTGQHIQQCVACLQPQRINPCAAYRRRWVMDCDQGGAYTRLCPQTLQLSWVQPAEITAGDVAVEQVDIPAAQPEWFTGRACMQVTRKTFRIIVIAGNRQYRGIERLQPGGQSLVAGCAFVMHKVPGQQQRVRLEPPVVDVGNNSVEGCVGAPLPQTLVGVGQQVGVGDLDDVDAMVASHQPSISEQTGIATMANQTFTLPDAIRDYLRDVTLREPPLLAALREETAQRAVTTACRLPRSRAS